MTAKKPALEIVREGNPGNHPRDRFAGGVKLKPQAPDEPAWAEVLPSVRRDQEQQERVKRLRGWARDEWRRVVPVLDAKGLLATVDEGVLLDHCVASALARECYRDLARDGYRQRGERGWQKHSATTVLDQQRKLLTHTRAHLGLSPLNRDKLGGGEDGGGEGGPFD